MELGGYIQMVGRRIVTEIVAEICQAQQGILGFLIREHLLQSLRNVPLKKDQTILPSSESYSALLFKLHNGE